MLWFHLVEQLTRYHLSHHVHPHPHIMESLGSEKPFQRLYVVPWESLIGAVPWLLNLYNNIDISLKYIYRLEPKHPRDISSVITTIVVMIICVKATHVSGLLSCHSFIKPTRHCRSVWPRLIMINIVMKMMIIRWSWLCWRWWWRW